MGCFDFEVKSNAIPHLKLTFPLSLVRKFGRSHLDARRPCFLSKEGELDIDRIPGFVFCTSFNSQLYCITPAETMMGETPLKPKPDLGNNKDFFPYGWD